MSVDRAEERAHPDSSTRAASVVQPARQSFFRGVPWRWSDVLIALAPAIAMRLLGLLPADLAASVPRWIWAPSSSVCQGWLLGFPLWIAWRRQGELPKLPRPRTVFREACWTFLTAPAVLVAMVVTSTVWAALAGDSWTSASAFQLIGWSRSRAELLVVGLIALLVAPVAEEISFRGLLYNKLRHGLPLTLAILLQAVVFGLLHPFGLKEVTLIVLAGLAFGLVYEWRKTLLAPIILHASVGAVLLAGTASAIMADAQAPRLGVYGEAHGGACRLIDVVPGSAADLAGLHAGDVVNSIDGAAVPDMERMTQIVRSKRVGDAVTIEFVRDGNTRQIEAILTRLEQ
jgi:membrane protease YdiL (CAAX protease family)